MLVPVCDVNNCASFDGEPLTSSRPFEPRSYLGPNGTKWVLDWPSLSAICELFQFTGTKIIFSLSLWAVEKHILNASFFVAVVCHVFFLYIYFFNSLGFPSYSATNYPFPPNGNWCPNPNLRLKQLHEDGPVSTEFCPSHWKFEDKTPTIASTVCTLCRRDCLSINVLPINCEISHQHKANMGTPLHIQFITDVSLALLSLPLTTLQDWSYYKCIFVVIARHYTVYHTII